MAGKFERKEKTSASQVIINLFLSLTVLLAIIGGIFVILFIDETNSSESAEDIDMSATTEVYTYLTEPTEIDERQEKFERAERLYINQQYDEAEKLFKELGTYKHANVLLSACRDRIKEVAKDKVLEDIKNWADKTDFDWPDRYSFSAEYYNSTPYKFDIEFTMYYKECDIMEHYSKKNIRPNDTIEVKFPFPSGKIEGEFHYNISWEVKNVVLVEESNTSKNINTESTIISGGKNSPQNDDQPKSNPICIECGKSASQTYTNPFSGKLEHYCYTHYQEIIDIMSMMESDVGESKQSKHTCEQCSREGTHRYESFTGQTEYYCTQHYEELKDLLNAFGLN